MKDFAFHEIKYYNNRHQYHKLIGPAIDYTGFNKYYINDIHYMHFDKDNNILYIDPNILELISEYEKYIKQNIKDSIEEYNPKIELIWFKKEEINELPDWLKDLERSSATIIL